MKHGWRALVIGLSSSLLIGTSHAALALSTAAEATGQWDISLNASNRGCRMTLHSAAEANVVSMPAGCKRSLPILAGVGAFDVSEADHLTLTDQSGQQVLDFTAPAKGRPMEAMGPQGEIYRLVAVAGSAAPSAAIEETTKPAGFQPIATKTSERAAPASKAALAAKPGDVAGRYAVLRDANRDTGCMITLDDRARAPKGGYRATLAPACRDQGIVIFDPMGWQLVSGHLVLTARKGHTAQFDLQSNETWMKDSKEGMPMSLKRL